MYKEANINRLLEIIRTGLPLEAGEASKEISNRKLQKNQIIILAEIAKEGEEIHNKESAAYALSWLRIENKNSALPFLINFLNDKILDKEVRAQCAEGIGYTIPDKRNKYRRRAEKTLLRNLKDPNPEVRFWCCFAIGQWKMKKAIGDLLYIKNHDTSICPGWWYVSEEAEDAIDNILGREHKERVPISQRK